MYNFDNPGFSESAGHFTQLVWKSSTTIGLGIAAGLDDGWNAYYCVAHYQAAGNSVSPGDPALTQQYFRANVLPPQSVASRVGRRGFPAKHRVEEFFDAE